MSLFWVVAGRTRRPPPSPTPLTVALLVGREGPRPHLAPIVAGAVTAWSFATRTVPTETTLVAGGPAAGWRAPPIS